MSSSPSLIIKLLIFIILLTHSWKQHDDKNQLCKARDQILTLRDSHRGDAPLGHARSPHLSPPYLHPGLRMAQVMAPDGAAPVFGTQVVFLHTDTETGRIPPKQELQPWGNQCGPTARSLPGWGNW